jgi:thiol-disulfide isomerase/thioredoxin
VKYLFFFFVLFAIGCSGTTDKPQEPISPQETNAGSPVTTASDALIQAPDFSKEMLTGGSYQLSERKGRVIIINFWATWCGPCVRETPAFVDLQNEWADEPFEIVGISMDEDGFEAVGPFVDRFEVPYPMLLDDGTLADEFGGVYAMPSSFILDKEGRIVHRIVGEFPFEDMREELEALIGA